jgi:hypothetical protein
MKKVLVSDLHGNADALQSVVDAESGSFVVLGDVVGLHVQPEVVPLVRDVGDTVLAGNHDKAVFEYGEGHVVSDELSRFELTETLTGLSADDVRYMLKRPSLAVQEYDGNTAALTHAYPWPEEANGYEAGNQGVTKSRVVEVAAKVADDYDYVFHGHTHTQYDLDASKFGHGVHFVNPGSLGYNGDYSVVDTATGTVEHHSVEVETDPKVL